MGGRTWLDLSVGGRTWLDFSVGLKLIWFLCGWSKLTCFFYEGRSSLVFSVSMPIYLNFMGGPNWLDFSLGIELDLIPVWDEVNMAVVVRVVENDAFQCGGSASIWFLCCGRKWLGLSVGIEINWVFVSGHQYRLDIRVGIEIDLISVMGSKLTWFFMCGIEISLVLASGSNLTSICAGVKIDCGFVCGPKVAWF